VKTVTDAGECIIGKSKKRKEGSWFQFRREELMEKQVALTPLKNLGRKTKEETGGQEVGRLLGTLGWPKVPVSEGPA